MILTKLISKIFLLFMASAFGVCSGMANISDFDLWQIKRHHNDEINKSELNLSLKILQQHFEKKEDNLFVSPFSIYFMSVLLANGATGETRKEFDNILFAQDKDEKLQDINKKIAKYITYVPSSVEINSSLWANNLLSDYKIFMHETFDTDVKNLPSSTKDINEWVNDKTKGKISSVMEEKNVKEGDCYIVNTVYFNDVWADSFDDENTHLMPFKSLDAEKVDEVYTMYKYGDGLDYFENDKMQSIRLPYKDGHSIQIFLPKENYDFMDFIKKLTVDDLRPKYNKFEGSIYLPKFEIDYAIDDMNAFFEKIGVKRIFDPAKSQLNAMSDENLFVNKIIHVAKIKVDEKGTEAAAATVAEIEKGMAFHKIDFKFEFKADHPFIFVIDNGLFVGAYVKGSMD